MSVAQVRQFSLHTKLFCLAAVFEALASISLEILIRSLSNLPHHNICVPGVDRWTLAPIALSILGVIFAIWAFVAVLRHKKSYKLIIFASVFGLLTFAISASVVFSTVLPFALCGIGDAAR